MFYDNFSTKSFNISGGTHSSFDSLSLNHLIKIVSNSIQTKEVFYNHCFDPFWRMGHTRDTFAFSHPVYPWWATRVVNEINNKFKNISIKIEHSMRIYQEDGDQAFGNSVVVFRLPKKLEDTKSPFKRLVLKVSLDGKYNTPQYPHVLYLIHHFFRNLSYTERYMIGLDDVTPKKDYIQETLNYSNRLIKHRKEIEKINSFSTVTHRSLTYLDEINELDFLVLDNIEAINKIFQLGLGRSKQSNLCQRLIFYRKREEGRLGEDFYIFNSPISETPSLEIPKLFRIIDVDFGQNFNMTIKEEAGEGAWGASQSRQSFYNLKKVTEEEYNDLVKQKEEMRKGLKKGTLVTGNSLSDQLYAITTSESICKVKSQNKSTTIVEVISHRRFKSEIGNTYPIPTSAFLKAFIRHSE